MEEKFNCICQICNKKMYLKPFRIKRNKNGITCSRTCSNLFKSKYMKGENNHQFGLIGDKNASFKGKEIISQYGYILEYCEGHPKPFDKYNKGTRVLQHRIIIERNYDKFPSKYFEEINGWVVLKDEYIVHHINHIKTDNRLENLIIMLKSEHTFLHNKNNDIERDVKGRIIAVSKIR